MDLQLDLFVGGADGVNTYRIPSLLVAPGGTLLAFCEARKVSPRDASPTDLVLKRSADGGRSWGPMQRIVVGRGEEAIMNPCPVVDGDSVLLFCINAHKTEHGRHRHLVLRSRDDGASWSKPTDVTDTLGNDTFIPGPGLAIRMRSGRLVVPGYVGDYAADRTRIASYSCAAYSDDGGQVWRLGGRVQYPMSNEAQVVERSDGSLLLNWRIQKQGSEHPGFRGTAVSRDGGQTWEPPVLSRDLNEDPCQAGFIRWPGEEAPARLLFSNPDTGPSRGEGARIRMTVRLSEDDGRTWPYARLIYASHSIYSCPAVLGDGTIALLYESGEAARYECIRLARFSMGWLKEGRRV